MVHMLRITCFPLSLLALCDKIPEVHQCFVLFIALKYSFYIACIIQSAEDWPGDRQNYYKKPRICLPTTRHGEHLCVLFVADKPVEIIFMLFFLAFYCQVFFFHSPNMHTLLPSSFIAQNIVYHIVQIIFLPNVHLVHAVCLRSSVQSVQEKILSALRISSQYSASLGR